MIEYLLFRVASACRFAEHLHSGLIDVIAPHSSYYPDLNNLKQTLGDSPERVKWRSKQNLDFALLMMYCQSKATFYVQLEDDILAKKNFITTMKTFALKKIAKKDPWFVLVFCQLGFIGETRCLCVKAAPFSAEIKIMFTLQVKCSDASNCPWSYSFS